MGKKITLKTGKTIRLEWNYLVLQYIEEELGTLEKLEGEFIKNNEIKVFNVFAYAIIQSALDEEVTLKQAIRMIEFEDMDTIAEFVTEELERTQKEADRKNQMAQNAKK